MSPGGIAGGNESRRYASCAVRRESKPKGDCGSANLANPFVRAVWSKRGLFQRGLVVVQGRRSCARFHHGVGSAALVLSLRWGSDEL
jgi:hypothetical protein